MNIAGTRHDCTEAEAVIDAIRVARPGPDWVAGLENGQVTLAPKEWQRPGFWEDCFDGEPSAGAEYERLRAEVMSQG
ncbi:hypothetical protein [Streptomyces sp. NPDC001348]